MKTPRVLGRENRRPFRVGLWFVALALPGFLGCFNSADPTRLKCKTQTGCPSGYVCDTSAGTCSPRGGSGGSQSDVSLGAGGEAGTGTNHNDGSAEVTSDALGDVPPGARSDATPDARIDAPADAALADAPADAALPDVPADGALPDAQTDANLDVAIDVPAQADGATPDSVGCPSDKVSCNGKCIDSTACCTAADCAGSCRTCNASNTCVALIGQDDPTGRCSGTCDSAGACKSKQGTACQTVGGGCAAGLYCSPDGVCCDKECKGSCEACDVNGSTGVCKTLAAKASPHTGHTPCTGSDVCAAACDGTSTSCAYPTVSCGTPSCTSSGYQAVGSCKSGSCSIPSVEGCTYTCDVNAGGCTGVCTPNQVQCSQGGVPQKCSSSGAWVNQTACGNGYLCNLGACTCASPKKECSGSCIDVTSDSHNCGACGHDCLGGTCSGGLCQPVAVAPSLGSTFQGLFGIDAQNLYYAVYQSGAVEASAYRVAKAAGSSSTEVVSSYAYASFRGVVSNDVFIFAENMDTNYLYDVTSTTKVQLGSINGGMNPASWGSSQPAYVPLYNPTSSPANITWYTTAGDVKASYDDTLDDYSGVSYNSFGAYQNTVFYLRTNPSSTSLFSIGYNASYATELLSSGLSSTMVIVDANAPSVLLWDASATAGILYRVPVGSSPSLQLITAVASTSVMATEDSSYLYWFDASGKLSRCSPSSSGCAGTTTMATGQSASGKLYQDDTALYWSDLSHSAIMKLAK